MWLQNLNFAWFPIYLLKEIYRENKAKSKFWSHKFHEDLHSHRNFNIFKSVLLLRLASHLIYRILQRNGLGEHHTKKGPALCEKTLENEDYLSFTGDHFQVVLWIFHKAEHHDRPAGDFTYCKDIGNSRRTTATRYARLSFHTPNLPRTSHAPSLVYRTMQQCLFWAYCTH